jgi:hypothetical protein
MRTGGWRALCGDAWQARLRHLESINRSNTSLGPRRAKCQGTRVWRQLVAHYGGVHSVCAPASLSRGLPHTRVPLIRDDRL